VSEDGRRPSTLTAKLGQSELQTCHVTKLRLPNCEFIQKFVVFLNLSIAAEKKMVHLRLLLSVLLTSCCPVAVTSAADVDGLAEGPSKHPDRLSATVVIAVLVRNKAYTLPYFLTALENLDYPKDRISLW